jgi:hypothetical protein
MIAPRWIAIFVVLPFVQVAGDDSAPSPVEVLRDGKAVAAIWCRDDGEEAALDLASW